MKLNYLPAVLIALPLFILWGCKKPVAPNVQTTAVSGITTTSMVCGGTVTDDGGAPVLSRGVCWSTGASPTADLPTKTSDGSGVGSFTSTINGLLPNTTYYLRAYATNEAGTAYGNQLSATTLPAKPLLTTTQVSEITSYSARSGGNITDDGGSTVTERGVCWSPNPNPEADLPTRTHDGGGKGRFESTITGLKSKTTYYVRAYAKNSAGVSYGEQMQLQTPASFTLSQTSLTLTAEKGNDNSISITAYLPWTADIQGNSNWITVRNKTGEAGTSYLSIDVQVNFSSENRTETIRISCQDMYLDIQVTQLRADGYIDDGDLF